MFQLVPPNFRIIPGNFQGIPANFGGIPGKFRGVPGRFQGVPANLRIIIRKSPGIIRRFADLSVNIFFKKLISDGYSFRCPGLRGNCVLFWRPAR
ncbi:MAG TPA: hypothetical protein VIH57_13860 [Bacteroidales bacterium]